QPPAFRSSINLALVDVVVRDRSGAVVTDLTADDFELLEDGVRQKIVTFAFEQIRSTAAPIDNASALAASGGARTAGGGTSSAAAGDATSSTAVAVPAHPLTSDEVAGHRLLT